jgi:hypothetical protein
LSARKPRKDYRTRRGQTLLQDAAFAEQLEAMTDAYLGWFQSLGESGLAVEGRRTTPESEVQGWYPIQFVDVFSWLKSFLIYKH